VVVARKRRTQMDYAIRAQFESESAADTVMDLLGSTDGISSWWSDSVSGSVSSVGDTFEVRFPTTPIPFELRVTECSGEAVEWVVDENPPWWKGTTIRFDVSNTESGCQIMFTHEGFDAADPIIPVITPAWVHFVDNLVAVAGAGTPNPAVRN
jgi:hypothetical protein